jgi:hypothetical protein
MFQKLPDMLKWIASLITAIVAVIAAYNQLAPTLFPILQKNRSTLPSNLIVYVSPDPFVAKSYLSILADTGLPTRYLDLNQIEQLPSLKPGVVIFGNEGSWWSPLELSEELLTYLRGDVKIVGMGELGLHLFNTLYTFTLFGNNDSAFHLPIFLDQDVPKAVSAGLPTTEPVYLYNEVDLNRMEGIAINDLGSLRLLGAQGIARYDQQQTCKGQSWSIVKYGNYVFWGYISEAEKITEAGKRLFMNVVKYEQETPYERPELEREYFKPGGYAGSLGCNFINNVYPIRVNRKGIVKVSVTSDQELWLVLNGPGQVRYYEREIAVSPALSYNVSSDLLRLGEDWFISVYYFGELTSQTRLKYEVEIDYPYKPPNVGLWLLVGFLGLGLFTITVFGLYRNFSQSRNITNRRN